MGKYHLSFIHSSGDGHVGCFQVSAIVNHAEWVKTPVIWDEEGRKGKERGLLKREPMEIEIFQTRKAWRVGGTREGKNGKETLRIKMHYVHM